MKALSSRAERGTSHSLYMITQMMTSSHRLRLRGPSRSFGMTRVVFICALSLLCAVANLRGQESTPSASASPSLEQRVSDLEAYMNNAARGADAANAQINSNITGPGPGHNGWMMICAALVLFMTLPGL